MNWLALVVTACSAPMVKDVRTATLFVVATLSVLIPIAPDDPAHWYWMVFCIDMSVALFALIVDAPSSRVVCLVAVALCLLHMAGATVIPTGLDPDPYTVIAQFLEALLILACITRKEPLWVGKQLPRLPLS